MESSRLSRKEITDNVIAIKISRSYTEGMSDEALYEATRGYWVINVKRAELAEYVFSVSGGVVKEVYQVEQWLPAGTIPRRTLPTAETPDGRYEFTGRVADLSVRNRYVGKSISHLYQKGEANPIKYFLKMSL